ncbi:hypothetical protein ETU08_11235 [Apibacter muscae]|uniref:restriction endonuclease subunit S n=1 Tax=Apibacter muscae TaxID=2509004 RepID=UPI0011ACED80|nr:restriction endonuclease subunit S [Apibacter muscae]TWP28275.1 hypothetical protein ETU08_11235 [Apibacter muscae]
METYKVPSHIDPDKIFLVNRSELEERLEPKFYTSIYLQNKFRLTNSLYPLVTIKNITSLVSDGTHFTPNYIDEGIKFISVKDVRKSEINLNNSKFISEKEAHILDKRCKPIKGDILLTKIGTIGLAAVVNTDEKFQIFVSLALLRPKNNILSHFLEIVLNSNLSYLQYDRIVKGSGVPDLHLEDIRKLKIPLPPLEIQQQIVDLYQEAYQQKQQKEAEAKTLLESIDTYLLHELGITLPQKENSLENRMFTTPFSEVSGGRLDPRYFSLYFKLFDKMIDCKYPAKTIKSISLKINSGATPKSGGNDYTTKEKGVPFIRVTNLKNNTIDFSDCIFIKRHIHEGSLKRTQLKKDNILLSMAGTIGLSIVVPKVLEANINQALAQIELKKDINPFFISEILNSSIGKIQMDRLSRPAVQANINFEEIKSIKIPLPPIEKQNEIAEHIQGIRAQAKELQEQAQKILEEAKQEVEKMILGD